MRILVTGASGFIGSFIVSEGLERGYEVWAGVRRSSSRQYLQDPRTRFAELDLSSTERLTTQLQALKTEMGGQGWDYVIHAAGATKSLRREGFFRTNTEGTQHLVEALRAADMMPQRLVFVSSLSVFGAIREVESSEFLLHQSSDISSHHCRRYPATEYGLRREQAGGRAVVAEADGCALGHPASHGCLRPT